jgi:hypothetical protein
MSPKISTESKRLFAAIATGILILLAVPATASAQQQAAKNVRDHRTPATVRDHRMNVRDHRTPVQPTKGGGVTVTTKPHKDDAFWP